MTTGAIERLINQVGQADNAGDLSYYIDGQTYVDAGEEILDLRAEVERLTADLSTCQDGNVDLLAENHELKRQVFALTTELEERTKSLKAANEMVNAWSDAAIQQNAKVNALTAERDALREAIENARVALEYNTAKEISSIDWYEKSEVAYHILTAAETAQDGQP